MSKQITLNSFEELAQAFRRGNVVSASSEQINEGPTRPVDTAAPELADLLAELQRAGATLATIARRDDEARKLALSELEQYDALLAQLTQAEALSKRARYVRRQATQLAENAFEDEAREAAGRVIELAERAEVQAGQVAEAKREGVERLASSMDVDRLLSERRRIEELERRRVAESERAGRLSAAITGARTALQAGRN